MKNIFFFCLVTIAVISCKEDEPSLSEFRFDVNSTGIISEGVATKTVSETNTLFEIHNLSRTNDPSEMISLRDIPFKDAKCTFGCKDISVILNNVDSTSQIANSYKAIAGNLIMESPVNGIIVF